MGFFGCSDKDAEILRLNQELQRLRTDLLGYITKYGNMKGGGTRKRSNKRRKHRSRKRI